VVVVAAPVASTITAPVIVGWMLQWYVNVPALGNTWVNDCPGLRVPEFQMAVSEVVVCGDGPWLVHCTLSPWLIVTGFGENELALKPSLMIVTVLVTAPPGTWATATVTPSATAVTTSARPIDTARRTGRVISPHRELGPRVLVLVLDP
jgi:hypothetical protein